MKRTLFGLAPLTLAFATFTVACGDDGDPGTDEGSTETAGDGDGDGDMTGDGDGDADTGDGDGDDSGDGDGDDNGDGDGDDDGGPGDSDGDGILDADDNCPDHPNPNQLDFDGNGIGNVCDVQVFTGVSGVLNTTGSANAVGDDCNIPIELTVTDGEIHVQLDDDAAVAGFEVVSLQFNDILEKECTLLIITAKVSIKEFMVANNGDPFPVSLPHTTEAHDAGTIAGDSDAPHPMLATGILEAATGNDEPTASDLMLDGELPVFEADISDSGAMGTLSWGDPQFVLATHQFMVDVGFPLGEVTVNFELRGLTGELTLTP